MANEKDFLQGEVVQIMEGPEEGDPTANYVLPKHYGRLAVVTAENGRASGGKYVVVTLEDECTRTNNSNDTRSFYVHHLRRTKNYLAIKNIL